MNAVDERRDVRGRRIGGRAFNRFARRTHCHKGHSLADAYDYGNGHRHCRTCKRAWQRARYHARKAVA